VELSIVIEVPQDITLLPMKAQQIVNSKCLFVLRNFQILTYNFSIVN